MSTEPQLHSSIIALVSLASGIAAKHPAMGICQLNKLREMGIPESQIKTVVEIARHIRDESSQLLDEAFDIKAQLVEQPNSQGNCRDSEEVNATENKEGESCCSSTPSGQSCC